jgi:hypothetical protein
VITPMNEVTTVAERFSHEAVKTPRDKAKSTYLIVGSRREGDAGQRRDDHFETLSRQFLMTPYAHADRPPRPPAPVRL